MNAHFLLLSLLATIFLSFAVKKDEVGTLILVCVPCVALYFFKTRWLDPWRIRWKLQAQGIKGPKPSLFNGNASEIKQIEAAARKISAHNHELITHDYTSTLFPYLEHWRKQYGPIYTYTIGNKQHLFLNHPELVKEMNHSATWDLGKAAYITKKIAPMLGNGIVRANGQMWAHQRKIIAPEFFMEKVKGMVGLMVESAESLASRWEAYTESHGGKMAEIKVDEDLMKLSADVILKTCFGSSYLKGKVIFAKLRAIQKAISAKNYLFSSGLVSIGQRNKIERLEKEVETLIWETVKERQRDCQEEKYKDLMQLILEGAANDDVEKDSAKRFIVDNCKNIYFAGYESTAITASWCLMLLALHPEWQDRIRAEVAQVLEATGGLNADSLPKLKTVAMVVHEVLRLYPPAPFVSRETLQETQLGDIVVPKGVCLWTLIPALHRDPDIWGQDVNEFNPERFANGISKACKLPQVYLPFGLGPRICPGKNFAHVELKIVIAIIISKFTFTLSPNYKHSPAYRMIVEPGQGLHLLIQRYGK